MTEKEWQERGIAEKPVTCHSVDPGRLADLFSRLPKGSKNHIVRVARADFEPEQAPLVRSASGFRYNRAACDSATRGNERVSTEIFICKFTSSLKIERDARPYERCNGLGRMRLRSACELKFRVSAFWEKSRCSSLEHDDRRQRS